MAGLRFATLGLFDIVVNRGKEAAENLKIAR